MSFLANLFSKSPATLVGQGRRALQAREWAEAKRHLEKALERAAGEPRVAEEARALLGEARSGLVRLNLQHADSCARGGEMEAALESLDVALENTEDPVEKTRIEQLRHRYRTRGAPRDRDAERAAASRSAAADSPRPEAGAAGGESEEPDFGDLDRFDLWLASLTEDAARRFEEEGEEFRRACVALEDGDGRGAATALDRLLSSRPDDPLLLFQRGRARLLTGDLPGAARDLEPVRRAWGFAALDAAGHLHVGLLLAEAYAAQGKRDEAEEVLRAAAEERQGDYEVWSNLGQLLVAKEALDEAAGIGDRLVGLQPRRIEGYLVIAEVARHRGELGRAVDALEAGIGTCCGKGGSCRVKPVDVPAARLLADLYLQQGRQPERVDTLLHQVLAAQGGEASWHDHFLFARLYKLTGRQEQMEQARARALASIPSARSKERAMVEKLLESHL